MTAYITEKSEPFCFNMKCTSPKGYSLEVFDDARDDYKKAYRLMGGDI